MVMRVRVWLTAKTSRLDLGGEVSRHFVVARLRAAADFVLCGSRFEESLDSLGHQEVVEENDARHRIDHLNRSLALEEDALGPPCFGP